MQIGVFGTGTVGSTIATKLVELGHDVQMGSRRAGNEKAVAWVQTAGPKARQGTFAEAAEFGELLFNCTSGLGSLEALTAAGAKNLAGKVLVNVSNPLDFSKGMPPSLFVGNTDSLAEQIQRTFPDARVVKSLNTMNAALMVNPGKLRNGDHTVMVAGNDPRAKAKVSELLRSFGWKDIVDAGDITVSRGLEGWVVLWVRLFGKFGDPTFNLKLVR